MWTYYETEVVDHQHRDIPHTLNHIYFPWLQTNQASHLHKDPQEFKH